MDPARVRQDADPSSFLLSSTRRQQSQIITSNHKDAQIEQYIHKELNEIVRNWFHVTTWIKYGPIIDSASKLIYYSSTTARGLQTLGEEYTGLVQIDAHSLEHRRLKIPSQLTRLTLAIYYSFSHVILTKSLARLEAIEAQEGGSSNQTLSDNDSLLRISNLIKLIKVGTDVIDKIHLAVFYFHGEYFHLAKRILGIKYLNRSENATAQDSTQSWQWIYKMLGTITASQLALSLGVNFYSHLLEKRRSLLKAKLERKQSTQSAPLIFRLGSKEPIEEENGASTLRKCSLCFETRSNSSATPCGHLFCWTCIYEWLQVKAECPLCREPCRPSRVIFLQNYH